MKRRAYKFSPCLMATRQDGLGDVFEKIRYTSLIQWTFSIAGVMGSSRNFYICNGYGHLYLLQKSVPYFWKFIWYNILLRSIAQKIAIIVLDEIEKTYGATLENQLYISSKYHIIKRTIFWVSKNFQNKIFKKHNIYDTFLKFLK